MINEILKSNGIKITKARVKILSEILNASNGISLKTLEKNNNSMNDSTIYRTIKLFLDYHIIYKEIDNDEVVFKMCGNEEHYVECIICHKKEKIKMCPLDKIDLKNYKILNHTIKIEGICQKCNK